MISKTMNKSDRAKRFESQEYSLSVQLLQDSSVSLWLTLFKVQECHKKIFTQKITSNNFSDELQYLFQTIPNFYKICFTSSNNFQVRENYLDLLINVGFRKNEQTDTFEEQQRVYSILLQTYQLSPQQLLRGWIKDVKYQYTIKRTDCDKKRYLQILKETISGQEQEKKKQWNHFLYKLNKYDSRNYNEFQSIVKPFSVDKIDYLNKQMLVHLGNCGKKWENLQVINLAFTGMGDEEMKSLCQVNAPQLNQLWLDNNKITQEGIKYLKTINLENLKNLYLDRNNIKSEGVKYLSQLKLPKLEQLYLNENNITAEGIKYLSAAYFLQIEYLYLNGNNIGDEGIEHLTTAILPKLEILAIEHNNVTEQGVNNLLKAKLPNLIALNLNKNNLPASSKDKLLQVFTKANIVI